MTTACELLNDASRLLEMLPPEESSDLITRIALYLGEPVHVGDSITIKSGPVEESWKSGSYDRETNEFIANPEVPEGLIVTAHESTYTDRDGNTKNFTHHTYQWPEAGEARYLASKDYNGGFVVAINGRRYRVDIYIDSDDGMPTNASVTFTRTDEPESEFQTWSHDAALAEYRARQVAEIESAKAEMAADTEGKWSEYLREDIARAEKHIARCDAGDLKLNHPFHVQVFGQPNFIQNEMFPMHNGRMGMALASIETGWGDSGNVNIMFACDDDGVPCRVWFEASCC